MILIQIPLILAAVVFIIIVLRGRTSKSIRAWKKLGLVFIALSMVIAVLFPELSNDVAHLVGVGRGADLLLYLTVVAFILYVLNDYLHKQEQKDLMYRLARLDALNGARQKYKTRLTK